MMKHRYFKPICLMATLALVACSSEEESFSTPESSQAIEVGTYIQQGTRATDKTAFAEGDAFGLYACQTTGDYSNSFVAGFMENVKVTKGATEWTYSPLQTWPSDENEHLSFVAFYPYNSEQTSPLDYEYTVNADPGLQEDILWASVADAHINDRNGARVNGSEADAAFEATSGALNLKFQHALSKVKFQIKHSGGYPDGTEVKLKGLTLHKIINNGTFHILSNLSYGYWTNLSSSTTSFYMYSDDEDDDTDDVEVKSEAQSIGEELLLIPQEFPNKYNSYIYVRYEHTTDVEGEWKTVTKYYPLTMSWEPNKTYTYVINVSLDVATILVSANVEDRVESVAPPVDMIPAEAIDLGLSVKWASYNVGATKPEEYGGYYGWGDPTGSYTSTSTSSAYYPSISNIIGSEYDIAKAKWGGTWRLPSKAEYQELIDNCTWTWMASGNSEFGVAGYKVTGKKEGYTDKSIFLPAAGYRSDTNYSYRGTGGYYWVGDNATSAQAYYLYLYNGGHAIYSNTTSKYKGHSIRPVKD